jgi:hypothetical protein
MSSFDSNTGAIQYYKGSIGSNTQIQLNIQIEGESVMGSFIYEDSGEVLVLKGMIGESSQSIALDVINDSDVHIAQIQAHYYTNELDEIIAVKGAFIDLKTGRRQLIDLEKIAEYVATVNSIDQSSDRF